MHVSYVREMIRPGCAAKLLQRAQMGVVRRGKFPYRSYMVECRMETNPTAATIFITSKPLHVN